MISPINNIARSASPQKSLNILSFICDGYFDSMLCDALPEHNFYGPINDGGQPNDWNFTLCPQPSNFHYIPYFGQSNIASKINFDLVLCHDRTSQYDTAQQIVHQLHINTIIVEHITNTEVLDLTAMIPLLKKTKKDTNVFVGDSSESFKIPGTLIRYGIANLYCKKKKNQIAIFTADQNLINNIRPHIKTPIVSHDIRGLTADQYKTILQESKFYFNLEAELTRLQLPILHAMSAGCVVVSISSPSIKDIINHMENGITIQNMDELLELWKKIDKVDTKKIAKAANKYIVDNHCPERFRKQWREILTSTANKTYIR